MSDQSKTDRLGKLVELQGEQLESATEMLMQLSKMVRQHQQQLLALISISSALMAELCANTDAPNESLAALALRLRPVLDEHTLHDDDAEASMEQLRDILSQASARQLLRITDDPNP